MIANQINPDPHNDNDQLLTENDTKLSNYERLAGFIQEYQVKIITKLNYRQTKVLFWVLNLELYLSAIFLLYIYFEQKCNQYDVFPFFSLLVMTIGLIEIVLKIGISFNLRKETYIYLNQENFQAQKNQQTKPDLNSCKYELWWIWALIQVDSFYLQSLSQKLLEYNSKLIDFDERINETHEQKVSHTSIQAIFSFIKYRQVFINLKMCVFLLLLKASCNDNYFMIALLISYILCLMWINIWINFHLACVYLFCRQCCLSASDILILFAEIAIKCIHSVIFLYILTHIDDISTIFSALFIAACTIMGITISISINTPFDSPGQGLFEMIFFGYSINYYVGLKHREYFVKRVAYRYKTDIIKQIIIFCLQIVIIMEYYEANIHYVHLKQEVVIAIISVLACIRVCMTLFKISYYLKPKSLLIRIKNFSGLPHFIEEVSSSPLNHLHLNIIPDNMRAIQQTQQANIPTQNLISTSIFNPSERDNMTHPYLGRDAQIEKSKRIKEILDSKMDQSQYKMTFFSESDITEYEINPEMKLVLSGLVTYSKSELIFLISNQVKILNQYGHINVLIHKYQKHLIQFIENQIMPHSRSIQIDSCYQHNTDSQIQIMLLYNTINRELDVNTKIILKPQDLVMKLPISYQRKKDFLVIVNQICNAKLISILKIISLNRYYSQFLYQNPCYVLYDLVDSDD